MSTELTFTGERKSSVNCLNEIAFGIGGAGASGLTNTQLRATPVPITPIAGQTAVAAGSGATSATTQRVVLATDSPGITTLGQAAMSASTPVVIASDQPAVLVQVSKYTGAANKATGQVATSTTAATFVVARPTRRSVLLRNLDSTISVYYGPATVTSSNGMLLKAGESVSEDWVGLYQVIAASGTPTVAYSDSYD